MDWSLTSEQEQFLEEAQARFANLPPEAFRMPSLILPRIERELEGLKSFEESPTSD